MEERDSFIDIFKTKDISINSYGSIKRAISLLKQYGENILLRHQADWVSGLLLGHWKYGEGSNNIRLGWDIINKNWIPEIKSIKWRKSLPIIISSGKHLGRISHLIARDLNLPLDIQIISGTTDSNAAVLATDSSPNEGVTVLGSTLVMKCYTKEPINSPGITNHRVGGKWVCGGASNSGGAVLKKFFTEKDLIQLSRQINPFLRSGLKYFPIATKGERFPIDDPTIEPILTPRPTSDALYLHGLLEGIANIEAQGWSKLAELGAHIPKKIITIGGGARNPQWRQIREQVIGIPIQTCTKEPAEGVARLAIQGFSKV